MFTCLFVLFCFLCLNPEVVSWKCSVKNCVLKSFAKFSGKHLCQSPFFNKVAGHSLLRIPFLQNTSCSGDCFWKSQGKDLQPQLFFQIPRKITVSFSFCNFSIMFHFILNLNYFFHWFYNPFSWTDIMSVSRISS